MTATERIKIVVCLLIIAGSLLGLCWCLQERTWHSCEVPGIGQFRFTIEPTIRDAVAWNGSTYKRIYWTKPDGSELCYVFGLDYGGYWQTKFLLVEWSYGRRGLLLEGDGQPAVIDFTDQRLHGQFLVVDSNGMVTPNVLPVDFAIVRQRQLSSGGPRSITTRLLVLDKILWLPVLVTDVVAALWLTGILIKFVRRRN